MNDISELAVMVLSLNVERVEELLSQGHRLREFVLVRLGDWNWISRPVSTNLESRLEFKLSFEENHIVISYHNGSGMSLDMDNRKHFVRDLKQKWNVSDYRLWDRYSSVMDLCVESGELAWKPHAFFVERFLTLLILLKKSGHQIHIHWDTDRLHKPVRQTKKFCEELDYLVNCFQPSSTLFDLARMKVIEKDQLRCQLNGINKYVKRNIFLGSSPTWSVLTELREDMNYTKWQKQVCKK